MKRGIWIVLILVMILTAGLHVASAQADYTGGTQGDVFKMDVLDIRYSDRVYEEMPGFKLHLNSTSMKIRDEYAKDLIILPDMDVIKYGSKENYLGYEVPKKRKNPRGKDLSEAITQVTSIEMLGRTFLLSQIPDIGKLFTTTAPKREGKAYRIASFGKKGIIAKPFGIIIGDKQIFTSEIYLVPKEGDKNAVIFYVDKKRELKELSLENQVGLIVLSSGRVLEAACKDSDGGMKPGEKGIAKGEYLAKFRILGEWEDYCKSDHELVEYHCENGKVRFNVVVCPAGCQGGVCIDLPYCIDSDGSLQYSSTMERYDQYVKSFLSLQVLSDGGVSLKRLSDSCSQDKTKVKELQCENNLSKPYKVVEIACGKNEICNDGKCVKEEIGTQAECSADADCGEGMKCEEGKCVEAAREVEEVECSADADCNINEVCKDNKCISKEYDFQSRIDRLNALKKRIEALERVKWGEESGKHEKSGRGIFSWFGNLFGLKSQVAVTNEVPVGPSEPPGEEIQKQAKKAEQELGMNTAGTRPSDLSKVFRLAIEAKKSKGGGEIGDLYPERSAVFNVKGVNQIGAKTPAQNELSGVLPVSTPGFFSGVLKNILSI